MPRVVSGGFSRWFAAGASDGDLIVVNADGSAIGGGTGGGTNVSPSIVRSTFNTAGGTSSFATVGVASGVVLAANASRKRCIIVNDSTSVVYLNIVGGAAVIGSGIRLNASGGSYDDEGSTQQAISGIAGSAGSNVTVTELV